MIFSSKHVVCDRSFVCVRDAGEITIPVGDKLGVERVTDFDEAYRLARQFMHKQKMDEDVYYQRQTMFQVALQVKKFKASYRPLKKVTLKLI